MEPQIKVVISFYSDGRLNVEGFPDNKIVAYGMLEAAHEIIHDFFAQKANNLVQPAVVMPFERKPS